MKSGFGSSSNYAKSVEVVDKNVNLVNNSSINDSASGDEDILDMLTKPTNQFGLRPTPNAYGSSNYRKGSGLANVVENFHTDADNISEDEDDESPRVTYPSSYQRSALAAHDSSSDAHYGSRPIDSVESHIDSNRLESNEDDESNESDSSDSSSREDLEIVESSSTYGKEGTDLDTPRSIDAASLPGQNGSLGNTMDGKASNINRAVDGSIINTAGQKNVTVPKADVKAPAAEIVGGSGCFGCGGSSSKKKSTAAAATAATAAATAATAAAASKAAAPRSATVPADVKPLSASNVHVADGGPIDDIMSEDAAAGAMSDDADDISHPSTSYQKALPTVTESIAECDDEDDDDDDDEDDEDDEEEEEELEEESISAVDSESVAEEATTPISAVAAPSSTSAYGATAIPIATASEDEYTAKHPYGNSMSGSNNAVAATAVGATAATGAGMAYGATAVPAGASSSHDEYAVKYAPSNSMSGSNVAVAAAGVGATAAAGAGMSYGATAAPKASLSGSAVPSATQLDVIPPAGPAVRSASASGPISSMSAPGGGQSAGGAGASGPGGRTAGTPLAVPTGKIPAASTLATTATHKTFCAEDDYGNDHQCCCPVDKKSSGVVGGGKGQGQGGLSQGGKGKAMGKTPKPLASKGLKYDGCTKTGFCCFVPFCVNPLAARKYKPNSLPRSSPNYRHPVTSKA